MRSYAVYRIDGHGISVAEGGLSELILLENTRPGIV